MFLGELGGITREATREEDRVPFEGLDLIELALGRGLEELEVFGLDLARDLDVTKTFKNWWPRMRTFLMILTLLFNFNSVQSDSKAAAN